MTKIYPYSIAHCRLVWGWGPFAMLMPMTTTYASWWHCSLIKKHKVYIYVYIYGFIKMRVYQNGLLQSNIRHAAHRLRSYIRNIASTCAWRVRFKIFQCKYLLMMLVIVSYLVVGGWTFWRFCVSLYDSKL